MRSVAHAISKGMSVGTAFQPAQRMAGVAGGVTVVLNLRYERPVGLSSLHEEPRTVQKRWERRTQSASRRVLHVIVRQTHPPQNR